jgi:hypothetical protein
MLKYKGHFYRLALSPEKKRLKNEWLLQQSLKQNRIPSFDETYAYLTTRIMEEDREAAHTFLRHTREIRERCVDLPGSKCPELLDPDITYDEERDILNTCVRNEIHEEYKVTLEFMDKNIIDGKNCYRSIAVPAHIDPADLPRLGVFWSINKMSAQPFRMDKQNTQRSSLVMFAGVIDRSYIDLFHTLINNLVFENTEEEVKFLPNAPIWINGYYKDSKLTPIEDYRRC